MTPAPGGTGVGGVSKQSDQGTFQSSHLRGCFKARSSHGASQLLILCHLRGHLHIRSSKGGSQDIVI